MNKEYVYSDLFKLLPQSFKVSKRELVPAGKTPAYSSDTRNNGRVGFVDREPLFKITEKAPVYLVFGDHTRTMNIVHEDFCVMDNVKVLVPLVESAAVYHNLLEESDTQPWIRKTLVRSEKS